MTTSIVVQTPPQIRLPQSNSLVNPSINDYRPSTRRPNLTSPGIAMSVLSSQPDNDNESRITHLGRDVIRQIAELYRTLPPRIFTVYTGIVLESVSIDVPFPRLMPRRHFLTLEHSVGYILERIGTLVENSQNHIRNPGSTLGTRLNSYDPSNGWTLWNLESNLEYLNNDRFWQRCDWTICVENCDSDINAELPYRSLRIFGGRLVNLPVYQSRIEDYMYKHREFNEECDYMDTVEEILSLMADNSSQNEINQDDPLGQSIYDCYFTTDPYDIPADDENGLIIKEMCDQINNSHLVKSFRQKMKELILTFRHMEKMRSSN